MNHPQERYRKKKNKGQKGLIDIQIDGYIDLDRWKSLYCRQIDRLKNKQDFIWYESQPFETKQKSFFYLEHFIFWK